MMLKKNQHQLFIFTKKEKIGLWIILIINLFLLFTPLIWRKIIKSRPQYPKLLSVKLLDSMNKAYDSNKSKIFSKADNLKESNLYDNPSSLFEFDPNEISVSQWKLLGVKEKTALTIQRYLSKGGRFDQPEDINKIWGIKEELKIKLIPYIRIKKIEHFNHFELSKADRFTQININTADSLNIETLPGIGPVLTHRILNFRKKLGGFYDVNQLKEVWGLSDSIFQRISKRCITQEDFYKIDINHINFNDLKSHPYFGYKLANSIINYRNQHGYFKSLDEIQKILVVDEFSFKRFSPYLLLK